MRHHKHPDVRAWLDKTPGSPCISRVSCLVAEPGRDLLRRGRPQTIRRRTFTDVTDLQTAIRTYIDSFDERAAPFSWTKTADELLRGVERRSIDDTRH